MLAALKLEQGQTDVAKRCVRKYWRSAPRNWGPIIPTRSPVKIVWPRCTWLRGRLTWQRRYLKKCVASRTAKLGTDHPDTLGSKSDLAVLYFRQGKYALAEKHYKDVLAIRSTKLGPNHRETINSQAGLAVVYRCMKKPEQAIPLLEEAIERSKANKYPVTSEMQAELGAVYCDAGRFAEAVALLEEVHEKSREQPELAWVGNALLTAYAGAGKKAEAVALATQQVRVARERLPADSLELAVALAPPGQALMEVEEYADAEPLLLANYEGLAQKEAQIPPEEKTGCAMLLRGWSNSTTSGANRTRQGGGG